MKRKIVPRVMLILLLTSMLTLAFNIQTVKAEPTTWIVDDDGSADFHTIQEAINAAGDGDTIFVSNGTYYENIIVNKTLTIIGENKEATIIDGGGGSWVLAVKVTASNIVFRGFTTRVSGMPSTHILLDETVNTVIADNDIAGGGGFQRGIQVSTSTNVTLSGNNITGTGPSISLFNSSRAFVTENNIMNGKSGIFLAKSFNNIVAGNNLAEIMGSAIWLSESFNNTIANNSIIGWVHPSFGLGATGIQMVRTSLEKNSSSYNTFCDNEIANCYSAIFIGLALGGHHNNVFLRNNMTNNYQGTYLQRSFNFTFRENTFSENSYSFGVYGDDLLHYIHDIDTSNTVNGKPVYYLTNQQNLTINQSTFPNVGYLALINSTNITVENLDLKENKQGLLMAGVGDSQIINNNITNNFNGIYLDILCSHNTFSGNKITNQSWAGVLSEYSFNDTLIHNTVSNNEIGVYLKGSFNNTLTLNTIANNSRGGVWLDYSFNNALVSNNIIDNSAEELSDAGVSLYQSYVNRIFHNNFINNQRQAYTCPGNIWDDGYPSGGNYWSDYKERYPDAEELDNSGIWDTPYVINAQNQDNYPLKNPFTPVTTATINVDPDMLNLKGVGKWITCYIELPEGYNVSDIDIHSMRLNDTLPVSLLPNPPLPVPTEIGDYDNDTIPDLMVKFNRTKVSSWIYDDLDIQYDNVTLTITGELFDGTPFEGTDTVKVLFPGDVDDDGDVDRYDFSLFAGVYGTDVESPAYNWHANFNEDQNIDRYDFSILAEYYGKTAV